MTLGTAKIANLMLANSKLSIGLSWRNLKAALREDSANNKDWAVLYLGSATLPTEHKRSTYLVDSKGNVLENDLELMKGIKGIVVLDGTWSQAKTLWWRNSWLLKLRRMVVVPKRQAIYHKIRKEPRKESLSTLESLAIALSALEENPKLEAALLKPLQQLILQYSETKNSANRSKTPKNAQ